MKIGIVGLPNVGKSTLFNSLTQAKAEMQNYPFTTIEPNVGIVTVPDERLEILSQITKTEKVIPAIIEFVDIAGLVEGASKGEGLGNKFLSHIRDVNAIVQVVRCFENTNIVHVDGNVDPLRDIEIINLELIYADIMTIEKKIERIEKLLKSDRSHIKEHEFFVKVLENLNNGIPARNMNFNEDEEEMIYDSFLLTNKPLIYLCNVDENSSDGNEYTKQVEEHAKKENTEALVISVKIEEEISNLETKEEREEMLEALGLKESGLDKLIKTSYSLLGLMSFITSGEKETRAWTIKKNTKAPEAAGRIHTDIERGFIKAEVISYEVLKELGSMQKAREEGKVRIEGKDYIMQEGDVVLFRFNV